MVKRVNVGRGTGLRIEEVDVGPKSWVKALSL